MIITFLAMTTICLHYGSMFEIEECREARMIPLKLHNFGEFTVVVYHLLINLDRLLLAVRPLKAESRTSKIYFFCSIFVAFLLNVMYVNGAHHEDFRKSIAFGSIFLVNLLNLVIEFKLYHYTNVVFVKTVGLVPLERRFELSTLILKFVVFAFYSLISNLKDADELPPFYFVLNVFWNLDCALFPWFFIMFNPKKKQKLLSFLKIETPKNSPVKYQSQGPKVQLEHFNQFKGVWKIES